MRVQTPFLTEVQILSFIELKSKDCLWWLYGLNPVQNKKKLNRK